jgi:hypothetical protein
MDTINYQVRETRTGLGNTLGTENYTSTFGQQLLRPQEDHTLGRAKEKLILSTIWHKSLRPHPPFTFQVPLRPDPDANSKYA